MTKDPCQREVELVKRSNQTLDREPNTRLASAKRFASTSINATRIVGTSEVLIYEEKYVSGAFYPVYPRRDTQSFPPKSRRGPKAEVRRLLCRKNTNLAAQPNHRLQTFK